MTTTTVTAAVIVLSLSVKVEADVCNHAHHLMTHAFHPFLLYQP